MSAVLPTNKFTWLVRREFWEYRGSFFWAPLITAMIMLAITLMMLIFAEVTAQQHGVNMSGFNLSNITAHVSDGDIEQVHSALDMSLLGMCFPIGIVLFFVLFFYGLGSLHNDRADRSVLFWKSLPLSDTETVLAKLFAITLLGPVLAIVAMILLQVGFLVLLTLYAAFHGVNAIALLWSPTHLGSLWFRLILRVPVNALWALPSVGWLFLCSSFVRSKPFLWATLIPILSGILVVWFSLMQAFSLTSLWYWKNIVGRALLSLVPGSWAWFDLSAESFTRIKNPTQIADAFLSLEALGHQLMSPQLWVGVVVGLAMIAASIYFRRRRIEAIA
jgi:ABC-2 type transport system permease protein